MPLKSLPQTLSFATVGTAFAVCILCASGAAMAAGGNVATIGVLPNVIAVNDMVTLKVGIADGSNGIACNLSWTVVDANNVPVKGGTHGVQNSANSADFTVQFGMANPGVYTVQATGGASTSQLTVCQGTAKTILTVKAKPIANPSNPGYPIPTRKQ